ncbi:MAG: hypothetical protein AMXMBFR58_11270 [Phycisphaerae bacterium]
MPKRTKAQVALAAKQTKQKLAIAAFLIVLAITFIAPPTKLAWSTIARYAATQWISSSKLAATVRSSVIREDTAATPNGPGPARYVVDITYIYVINGIDYVGSDSSKPRDSQALAQSLMSKFTPGAAVSVTASLQFPSLSVVFEDALAGKAMTSAFIIGGILILTPAILLAWIRGELNRGDG